MTTVPQDFEDLFLLDYVTRSGTGAWTFVETGPDQTQIRFGTPLTEARMERLRTGT